MISLEVLSLVGFLLSATLLGYSAYSDLKTREVANLVWAIYLPSASAILGLKLYLYPQLLTMSLTSIVVMTGLSLLMFYLGLFGGADLKAFVCLSVALPMYPLHLESMLPSMNPIFALTVFYNAYFFSIITVIYAIVKNVDWKYRQRRKLFEGLEETSFFRRVMALLTGYKTNFETLKEKVYLYPMEEVSSHNGGSCRRLKLFTHAETDRDKLVKNLGESLKAYDRDAVWVTPGIPLLVFVWVALITNAFLGDVLMWTVFQLLFRIS